MYNDPIDDNTNYNKLGLYYNPDDNRVIVPKRMRWAGFTLNFARKEVWLVIAIIVIIGVLLAIGSS